MSDPLFYLASLRDLTCYVLRFVIEYHLRANASQSCQLYFRAAKDHTEFNGIWPRKSTFAIYCHVVSASVVVTRTGSLRRAQANCCVFVQWWQVIAPPVVSSHNADKAGEYKLVLVQLVCEDHLIKQQFCSRRQRLDFWAAHCNTGFVWWMILL